ncbi:TPR repeat-containing protein [Salinimicrobium catena]|uniref:TPR repeat-containing protein n=2 Tax=Salinimicrobium catena TaxID=390640 RepID=A0A1H5J1Z4_9FLAO|nr:tetratricopeptide repeat protein [Salinimicrobium catena]SDK83143.1 TPR repeat-containing protein [Salinimicrobium catena]SEE46424.1 TPR repeat-containing protein [Salinimicrobium catena]
MKLMKIAFLSVLLLVFVPAMAQEDPEKAGRLAKKYMQEAEAALEENDLAAAEALYRKAIAKDPSNAEARYNLGNIYYNNEITGEAVERHTQSAKVAEAKPLKHDAFHNQGNSFMKQEKYREAVEAYKNSLRNNPNDEETRYNLALAKKMLEEEKKGGGDENKDDQKKDQQDQKKDQKQDNKDQEGDEGDKEKNEDGKPEDQNKGGEKDDKDKKEGDDKKENDGKPKDDEQQKNQGDKSDEEQPRQPQPRPGQLSPQQVKNLLEAMGNEEKKVQEKINAKKMKGAKTKTEKDW